MQDLNLRPLPCQGSYQELPLVGFIKLTEKIRLPLFFGSVVVISSLTSNYRIAVFYTLCQRSASFSGGIRHFEDYKMDEDDKMDGKIMGLGNSPLGFDPVSHRTPLMTQ